MIAHGNKIKLFAGNGSPALAKEIAKELNMPLGEIKVGKFSDGETSVQIDETVRGCDVFIIQSTSTPVNDNLVELLVMIDAMRRASAGRITAVVPYFGYARQDRKARARAMANQLDCPLAIVDKRRPKANVMEVMNIVGDVSGKTCLLIDDMIDTAGTITQGAKALVEVGGAKEVYVCCTHAVLSGPAIERLENSVIKKVYMLNTIELTEDKKISKIEEITVAPLFARAIESIFAELPLSRLYE